MNDNDQVADPQAKAEWERIRTDPSHPMNARYVAKDQAVHDHVWELCQKAWPGNQSENPVLDDLLTRAWNLEQAKKAGIDTNSEPTPIDQKTLEAMSPDEKELLFRDTMIQLLAPSLGEAAIEAADKTGALLHDLDAQDAEGWTQVAKDIVDKYGPERFFRLASQVAMAKGK